MLRNLYRFYLYTVSIALLIYVAFSTGQLLNTLLAFVPFLNSSGTVPDHASIVQSLVSALVAWVIAGTLGGLHYWLIRRDMRNDPDASTSAIRAFFLNITEALGVAIAVPFLGFTVLNNLSPHYSTNLAGSASFALTTFALVGLLELERRRTPTLSGAALGFQRLHFYGVQFLLLIFLAIACFLWIRPIVAGLLFHSQNVGDPGANVLGSCLSILWFIACWIGYGWLLRTDTSRITRFILHGASFASGIGSMLASIVLVVQLVILPWFKLHASLMEVLGYSAKYDFISPFTLGLLVAGVYHLWLTAATKKGLINWSVQLFTEFAIVAILSAATFYLGCGLVLYNTLQVLSHVSAGPDAQSWVAAISTLVAGPGYLLLDFYLRRRNILDPAAAAGPRRGFVLALLGGGILALAIGGATALYAWGTSLLGSPINNWLQVAHAGLAAFLVGALLAGIYLWAAIREQLLSGKHPTIPATPSPAVVAAPATTAVPETLATPLTIEDALDQFQAGKITRDEAVRRIRTLYNVPVNSVP